MRRELLLIVVLALALACGKKDDDGDDFAAAFEGFWLFSSATFDDGSGPQTVTRNGTPVALRGDARFTRTGNTAGDLVVRLFLLNDGVVTDNEVEVQDALSVAVDATHWVVTDASSSNEVTVLLYSLAGDTLTLTYDEQDPRNTNPDPPPEEMILTKAAPWTATTVGAWDLVSIDIPSAGTIAPTDCVNQGPGVWMQLDMHIEINDDWIFTNDLTMTAYTDDQCTMGATPNNELQTGYAEEENNTEFRVYSWSEQNNAGESIIFSVSVSAPEVTLTRTSCEPSPACEGEVPTEVVVTASP